MTGGNLTVYKILLQSEWPLDETASFPSPIDERDGFVHLSTAVQALRVANLFYTGEKKIIVLSIPISNCNEGELKWEAPVHPTPVGVGATIPESELYPHLYGKLSANMVARVLEVSVNAEGKFDFGLE